MSSKEIVYSALKIGSRTIGVDCHPILLCCYNMKLKEHVLEELINGSTSILGTEFIIELDLKKHSRAYFEDEYLENRNSYRNVLPALRVFVYS